MLGWVPVSHTRAEKPWTPRPGQLLLITFSSGHGPSTHSEEVTGWFWAYKCPDKFQTQAVTSGTSSLIFFLLLPVRIVHWKQTNKKSGSKLQIIFRGDAGIIVFCFKSLSFRKIYGSIYMDDVWDLLQSNQDGGRVRTELKDWPGADHCWSWVMVPGTHVQGSLLSYCVKPPKLPQSKCSSCFPIGRILGR